MKILGTVENKKELVKKLSDALGAEAIYLRAPSFAYQIGPYLVTKNGDLEVDDQDADKDLLRELFSKEVIDDEWDAESSRLDIAVPTDGHSVRSLMNLIHMFSSREKLLNRSVGNGHAFLMNKKFVAALDDKVPASLDEFFKRLGEAGGPTINRGLSIEKEKITVSFPYTENSEITRAYADLVSLMNKTALTKKRISKDKVPTENEKYTFRVWLIHLGMNGTVYKDTRKVLLKNMPGNGAFRTSAQAAIAKEKVKEKRKEVKETSEYIEL